MITELWLFGLGIGLLVAIIVVILLLGIIFQTKRIIRLASVALEEVNQIEKNTLSIWKLNQTNIHTHDKKRNTAVKLFHTQTRTYKRAQTGELIA